MSTQGPPPHAEKVSNTKACRHGKALKFSVYGSAWWPADKSWEIWGCWGGSVTVYGVCATVIIEFHTVTP